MSINQIVLQGIVHADGTLELPQPLDLKPGPVEVILRPVSAPAHGGENWLQYLQRARAELEAMGHRFSTGEEINAYIEDLRSGDERVEEVYRADKKASVKESL